MRDPFIYVSIDDIYQYIDTPINQVNQISLLNYIKNATIDIDTLTFNRITNFESLTDFQKNILKNVCLRFAAFKVDNADFLDSSIKSYSINGVSMSFDDSSIKQINGIYIPNDIYAALQQTGLTCRII